MVLEFTIVERDEAGRNRRTLVGQNQVCLYPLRNSWHLTYSAKISVQADSGNNAGHQHVADFLAKVFLPSGYPKSVTTGFGVGDPSATATHALLLTVVQDVFGRFTTILGAYALGSSLVPEAKSYRFLADVLNDTAVILDTFSPLLISPSFPLRVRGLRIGTLCMSASCRALCGIVGGGSKAAITLHFATPINGVGDVGDLNAKDSSKETVLALLGILLGTFLVPHINGPRLTYSALFLLVILHLLINYVAVCGLELRTLNRQRAGQAWNLYRLSNGNKAPSPTEVSRIDNVLGRPDAFRDDSGRIIGRCTIGSHFSDVFHERFPSRLLQIFAQERYMLWYDHQCLCLRPGHEEQDVRGDPIHLHIVLKENYSGTDQLKAWCHAADLCRTLALSTRKTTKTEDKLHGALDLIVATLESSSRDFPSFFKHLHDAGWNIDDIAIMAGAPKAVLIGVEPRDEYDGENKKFR
ncbi:hypothetical protein C0995_010540 [Termitomyces sp. Mi166|nr:hypothetical protein C0995_010540 [Termitomyces sp. Mi166\